MISSRECISIKSNIWAVAIEKCIKVRKFAKKTPIFFINKMHVHTYYPILHGGHFLRLEDHFTNIFNNFYVTRKYPLCGYILVVLTHTTTWDQLLGGDVSLRLYIQLKSEKKAPLLNKYYWNEGTLNRQNPPLKCC